MPHNLETLQIHEDLLKILKIFNELCLDNNIRYSLHGGTLLGCIRENGFIPWDDDADISIKRNEFIKLKALLQDCKGDLMLDTKNNRFPQLWLKIEGRDPVWMDIFIWDNISEIKCIQKIKIFIMCFFLAFLKTDNTMRLSTESRKYTGIKHFMIFVIFCIGKLFPLEFKYNMADKASQLLGGKGRYIHRANDLYAGMKLILPAYVMEAYEYHKFEGIDLMVSKYYKEILESSYGKDYMIPVRMTENETNTHILARKLRN